MSPESLKKRNPEDHYAKQKKLLEQRRKKQEIQEKMGKVQPVSETTPQNLTKELFTVNMNTTKEYLHAVDNLLDLNVELGEILTAIDYLNESHNNSAIETGDYTRYFAEEIRQSISTFISAKELITNYPASYSTEEKAQKRLEQLQSSYVRFESPTKLYNAIDQMQETLSNKGDTGELQKYVLLKQSVMEIMKFMKQYIEQNNLDELIATVESSLDK